jgi:hypothetical protein
MPKATNTNTPKRRAARGFTAAELAAGLATPAVASTQPDAELIVLCDEAAANYAKIAAANDGPDALYERETELSALIKGAVPPTTLAGARAMAGACLAFALRDNTGKPYFEGGDGERFALSVVQFLAGGGR